MGFHGFLRKRGVKTADNKTTRAAELTLRESIWPIALVTVLFFLWGFSYGLLDTLKFVFHPTVHSLLKSAVNGFLHIQINV